MVLTSFICGNAHIYYAWVNPCMKCAYLPTFIIHGQTQAYYTWDSPMYILLVIQSNLRWAVSPILYVGLPTYNTRRQIYVYYTLACPTHIIHGQTLVGYAWVCPGLIYMGKNTSFTRGIAHMYYTWVNPRIK